MTLEPHFDMVLLLMTNRCNLTCKHCYVSSSPLGDFGLERADLLRIVDEIVDSLAGTRLTLSGGEPLARRDDALATLSYASGRLPLLLLTNGTLITSDLARRLGAIEDLTIRVSLDGPNAITHDLMRGAGSFHRLMRGIKTLLDAGFSPQRLEAFATVPNSNAEQIDDILTLALACGITRVKLEPVAKTGRAAETWPRNINFTPDADTSIYRRKVASMAGSSPPKRLGWSFHDIQDTRFNVLNIYSDGSVYPFTYQDNDDQHFSHLGNIHSEPLSTIINRDRVSAAVIAKTIRLLRGPDRSLRAIRAEYSAPQK
ncbi:radical SAM protein [Burkholderia sp. Bp9099]|uniref:radical SAM protein n=1 Tax=Burkholderia sp. Bp9099 TaxID=2184568 RepID=UPI000FB4279E|nr:radical SAM protein [Burkholderia sp. Bp9099]RQZ50941.1 radical SAM protein [Burkholderia sp. Bp9099]